jgi:hypothetical protein
MTERKPPLIVRTTDRGLVSLADTVCVQCEIAEATFAQVLAEITRLKRTYTMKCGECGYIRAKHPRLFRDCSSGFRESEYFGD